MIQKLTDRILYMPGNELTDRPYLYYIRGEEKSMAIDGGCSANHITSFYRDLQTEGLPLPDYTVLTHWHWDHSFGLCGATGMTIASSRCNEKLRYLQQLEWSEAALDARVAMGEEIPFCASCMKREYPYLSDIHIVSAAVEIEAEDLELDLGGLTCRIMHRDATHSRDSLFIYIPQEKALAVGDADYEDYYENDYRYDQAKLIKLTSFISSMDFQHCLRGHDGPVSRQESMEFLRAQVGNTARSGISEFR